jgi:hypothetical protein
MRPTGIRLTGRRPAAKKVFQNESARLGVDGPSWSS